MTDGEFERELDRLFSSAPEQFVTARTALVRTLKVEGRADDSAHVKAMRRPTRPVWALNRLALADGDVIRNLVEAAGRAAEIQSSGGPGLREAIAELRSATHDTTNAAVEAIDPKRPSDRIDVAAALQAVVAQPDALALLAKGRLLDVPEPGFGAFGAGDAGPTASRATDRPRPRSRPTTPKPEGEGDDIAASRLAAIKQRADARSAVVAAALPRHRGVRALLVGPRHERRRGRSRAG